MEKGRKIESIYENPIDNLLISLIKLLSPIFYMLNITPNMITTMSLIITLIGVHFINEQQFFKASILIFIGYIFDCWDGYYARTYNMTTKYGDIYDHVSDTLKTLLIVIAILSLKIKKYTKILFIIILFITVLLTIIHLGCQEKVKINNKKNESNTLNFTKLFCINNKSIIYTKYFGCGTHQLIQALFIMNIKNINKLI